MKLKKTNVINIIKFQLNDFLRSRWLFIYAALLFAVTFLLSRFNESPDKLILSVINITLILNPLISLIFTTVYSYNSREFIELILAQPVKRSELFIGLYLGITVALTAVFLASVGLPLLLSAREYLSVLLIMLLSGSALIFIFTAISFGISYYFKDKAKGLGAAIIVWIFFVIIYDGLILLLTNMFSDYPLEIPVIAASIINPVDLGRIAIMLKLDLAALMGYTGAVFEDFFGSGKGMVISAAGLLVWLTAPLLFSFRIFRKKNF